MESGYTLVVIGNSEAMDILTSIQNRLPHKNYNKIFGLIKIDRFLGNTDEFNFPYVTVNEKQYIFVTESGATDFKKMKLDTNTAAFIVAFSVVDFKSSFAIARNWIPAMKLYFPNIPIMLVGYNNTEELQKVNEKRKNTANNCSVNLTNDAEALSRSNEISNTITTEKGKQIAREIRAANYFEIFTSKSEESNMFEEAIRAFLRNRKLLRSCKIAVVGSPDSGKTEIIQRFVFGERLSVLDEYLSEQQYLYYANDTIFATSIEIDGAEFDLRIQNVSVEKVNKKFQLLNVENLAPIMEELKDSANDEESSAEDFGERFSAALFRRMLFTLLPSGIVKQGLDERTIEITYKNLPPKYWLKDIDVAIFIFSVVQPESFHAITEELVSETLNQNESGIPPIILVGNQIDLRNDSKTLNNLSKQGNHPITSEMGEHLARKINAVTYLNCSCNEQNEIEKIFEEAVWKSLRKIEQEIPNQKSKSQKQSFLNRIFKW